MQGAVLPGNSTVEITSYAVPQPGRSQVLPRTNSSTICGSNIRATYREQVGREPEG
jgi:threonine dehydrogenase-like Zn-dependent dehydrogenase